MRGNFTNVLRALALTAILTPRAASGFGVSEFIEGLAAPQCIHAKANYRVWLPQNTDAVEYTIEYWQTPATGMPEILPFNYLIDWAYESGEEPTRGFSAYYAGNHFRYNGSGPIAEYHYAAEPAPFIPLAGLPASTAVQRSAQFVGLLPAALALELSELMADEAWEVTATGNRATAVRRHDGEEVARRTYTLDSEHRPVRILWESNIGSVSEQSIEASIEYLDPEPCPEISEALLLERFPQTFGSFRRSNYSVESLEGKPLPRLALSSVGGDRWVHEQGEPFGRPTIIAFIDPETALVHETVALLRRAASTAPVPVELVIAFTTANSAEVEELAGTERTEERLLLNAASTAMNLGAANLPTAIICGADGKVRRVVTGYNQDLPAVVIQTTTSN